VAENDTSSKSQDTKAEAKKEGKTEARTGSEFPIERYIERYVGNTIHVFLSLLAIAIFAAAIIATYDTLVRDFPKLWQPVDEYSVLQKLIENILLIAIAAELGLLLVFHRTSAAVEVIVFLIARKMVSPGISMLELLIGTAAVIAMVIVRFYYLPGKPK
jgi:hypothetical protein